MLYLSILATVLWIMIGIGLELGVKSMDKAFGTFVDPKPFRFVVVGMAIVLWPVLISAVVVEALTTYVRLNSPKGESE